MAKPRSKFKKVKWLFGKEIEIPTEWTIRKLNELGNIITGNTPSTSIPGYYGNDYLWTSPKDLDNTKFIENTASKLSTNGFKISRAIPENSILVVCIGSTIGKIGIAPKTMSSNQQINSIICNSTHPEFIYYLLLQNNKMIKNLANQAAVPILNKTDFGTIRIILPCNYDEQVRIASILSGVDALIESTQKTIEKTERLKKGLMQKLLTKGIEHTKFKKTNGLFRKKIKIPEEWSSCQLKDTSVLNAGGTPSTFAKEFWNNGTIPWVSSSEVKNNRIIDSDKKITKLGLESSAAKLFPKGTVLVAITGFGMTRGRSAILEINASTNQSVVGIQSKREILDGEFLWYLLQNQYWVIRNFAQGSQQPGLNLDILEKFQICVPNNISEQQKIASILSGVDAYIQKNQEYKKKTELLKKGLMQKLLTGQIRVKVDH